MKTITRTVLILSMVSLLTDAASEMLYPVMPLYLKSIGFSIVMIGILEGLAEAMAGLSKGYFGKLSDASGQRMPFVQWGYGLSALSKPLMALFIWPVWIFLVRTLDRLGKGMRTGARDAILSDEATAATKGRVFGFHRAMDTAGAVIGPLIALVYLQWRPGHYRPMFVIAFIPGLLAVGCSLLLKDKGSRKEKHPVKENPPVKKETLGAIAVKTGFFSFLRYWKNSPLAYKKLVSGLLLFTLFNSSDVFLLLKARMSGLSDSRIILVYVFYNLVYAASSYPIGILADKAGLKKIFLAGLLLFATVYFGMAFTQSEWVLYMLFFAYGIYAAATEGISKAWISNIADKKDVATAIGAYSGFQSIGALLASSLAGLIWSIGGPAATFIISGVAVTGVAGYMASLPFKKEPGDH